MGLDMYLRAERYISPYSHNKEDRTLSVKILQVLGLDTKSDEESGHGRVTGVIIRAAYWRKANAIHNWFVDNVQEGVDNCATYYVSREQLDELRDLCEDVYAHRHDTDAASYAETKLPVTDGCFFGDQTYGEYYYADLKYTIEALKPEALDVYKDFSFEYQASW